MRTRSSFFTLLMAAFISLALSACLGAAQGGDSADKEPAGGAAPESEAQPTSEPFVSDLQIGDMPAAGKLAVVGTDGNIYVLESGAAPAAITDDAVAGSQDTSEHFYAHPTWSHAGWLSYVGLELGQDAPPEVTVNVTPLEGEPPATILDTDGLVYIYGYWSPAPCPDRPGCEQFAYLMNDGTGGPIGLHLAEVESNAEVNVMEETIGEAGSFYYSWSPDGRSMLWLRDGSDLSVYDVGGATTSREISLPVGRFQAPGWSPVDNRLLFARDLDGENLLTIVDDSDLQDLGTPVSGSVFFSWAPSGENVAYAHGGFPMMDLTIVGTAADSESIRIALDRIISFFWSPDGSKLAVVTVEERAEPAPSAARVPGRARPAPQNEQPQIQFVWHVVDVATGEITRLSTFFPTQDQFYIFQFFDQFAQSHRLWSPDGRYLVYADQFSDSAAPLIRLIDTESPQSSPITVMEGTQAIFSFTE
jgi:TolB protein